METTNVELNHTIKWYTVVFHIIHGFLSLLFRLIGYVLNIALTALLVVFVAGIITGSIFALYIKNYIDPTFDTSLFLSAGTNTTSTLYYYEYESLDDRANRNGTPVEYTTIYSSENSIWCSYEQMQQVDKNGTTHSYLVDAFISIEDHRFWSHNGVDWTRTFSAAAGFLSGNTSYGGSTITQQLVKNLTGDDEVKITRKIQEILRALDLAKKKSREEIIEMYLNIVYLGNNCYGVQSAAQYYFGKDVSQLSLEECASLASIVKNPSAYDPKYHDVVFVNLYDENNKKLKDEDGNYVYQQKVDDNGNPVFDENGEAVYEEKGNRQRRRYVLGEMLRFGAINYNEYLKAYDKELVIVEQKDEKTEQVIFSWYTDAVFKSVRDALVKKYNCNNYMACTMIYKGGLKIYIAMDPEIQSTMEKIFLDCYNTDYFLQSTKEQQPQYSMVVMDPYTGDVLGLVGGTGEKTMNLISNRATDTVRPVGSSIKPLSVYAPALENGVITYGTVYDDTPYSFYINGEQDEDGNDLEPSPWPKNYELTNLGLTNVNAALKRSCNTVSVKILSDLGVRKSFDFVKNKLHIDSLIESKVVSNVYYSDVGLAPLALGQLSYGATCLEMTSAYCIFANGGVYNEPNLWLEVYDSEDNLVISNVSNSEIVISEETADLMTIMMRNVINGGTASTTSIPLQKTVNCAGKTGTTDSDYDRWFLGYTPYYVGGAWVGYDMNMALGTISTDGQGFEYAPTLKLWNTVMTEIHQEFITEAQQGGEPLKTFSYSSNITTCTVCKDSGKLITDACLLDPRGKRSEVCYYVKGTEPKDFCECHTLVYVDDAAAGGVVPNLDLYHGDISKLTQVALLKLSEERYFPMELAISDAQYVISDLMDYVIPSFDPLQPYFYSNFAVLKEQWYPTPETSEETFEPIDPPIIDPDESSSSEVVDPPEITEDTTDPEIIEDPPIDPDNPDYPDSTDTEDSSDSNMETEETTEEIPPEPIKLERFVYGGISGTTNYRTGIITVGKQYNRLSQNCGTYEDWFFYYQQKKAQEEATATTEIEVPPVIGDETTEISELLAAINP